MLDSQTSSLPLLTELKTFGIDGEWAESAFNLRLCELIRRSTLRDLRVWFMCQEGVRDSLMSSVARSDNDEEVDLESEKAIWSTTWLNVTFLPPVRSIDSLVEIGPILPGIYGTMRSRFEAEQFIFCLKFGFF